MQHLKIKISTFPEGDLETLTQRLLTIFLMFLSKKQTLTLIHVPFYSVSYIVGPNTFMYNSVSSLTTDF